MIAFWLTASALVAMALLLLLPPLLRRRTASGISRQATNVAVYRDQLRELENDLASGIMSREGYDEAKREIERRLLDDAREADQPTDAGTGGRHAAVFVGAALPIVAFALYFAVGNFPALLPGAGTSQQDAHRVTEDQIRELTGRLAARMEKEPDDVEGWIMLGRSYGALGEFDKAARAFGNAVARSGQDAGLLADYADALAMAQGRRLEGEPEKWVLRALAIDSQNVKALALAGSAAFERGDFGRAVEYWERILKLAPAGSELAQSVRSSIEEARAHAGQGASPKTAASTDPAKAKEPAPQKSVSGVVQLSPALASRVAPDDTLFVFARAADGPRMPLAIVRAQARELPFKFTLDDTSAMAAGMTLSSQRSVIIGARVSRSGSASPQPGDLQGMSPPVDVGKSGVVVVIDAETK